MAEKARDYIRAMIYPREYNSLSESERAEFDRAVGYEEEYLSLGGKSVSSEAVGDVKVTYSESSTRRYPICEAAYSVLLGAGLLGAWV